MQAKLEKLKSKLKPEFLKQDEPLSLHTTVRIGGPADLFYEPDNNSDLIDAVNYAKEFGVPVTMLGRGSNVLISDKGIRGLVISSKAKNIFIEEQQSDSKTEDSEDYDIDYEKVESRWASDGKVGTFKYEFKDLDYDESDKPRIRVRMESGVDMPYALNYLIGQGITGLQWYSKIPGKLGGWIHNNVHGGTHFLNEVVESVKVITQDGEIKTLTKNELGFEYDASRFHNSNEIILEATLLLYKGDAQRARQVVIEWAKRKAIQPPISPGCVFKNLSNEEKYRLGYPTTGIGYLVEHVLKLSGVGINDAIISPRHHNFIENKGNATAEDFLKVVRIIKNAAKEKVGINLITEIFFLGFEPEEIADVVN